MQQSAATSPSDILNSEFTYPEFEKNLFTQVSLIIGYSEMLLEATHKIGSSERFLEIEKIRDIGRKIYAILSSALDPIRISETFSHFAAFHHLIDAPLTQLNVQVQFLLNETLDSEDKELAIDFETMRSAAQTLYNLIDSMPSVLDVTSLTHFLELKDTDQPKLIIPQDDFGSFESDSILSQESNRLNNSTLILKPESNTAELVKTSPSSIQSSGGRILLIDADPLARTMLRRRLEQKKYYVIEAATPEIGWNLLQQEKLDLVFIDLDLAHAENGLFLSRLKSSEAWHDLAIIMLSVRDLPQQMIEALKIGAEDCLPKACDSLLLSTRIEALLEKKRLQDREKEILKSLRASEASLQQELNEAAHYVFSLLPKPMEGTISTEWKFLPSARLGGDSLGYHPLDSEHWAFYVLDVCGHGVGAALLSVSVLHALQSQTLTQTDFHDPGSVLSGLNAAFRMEKQNGMYFTIWYGVYHEKTRKLRYSSGGHSPAILMRTNPSGQREAIRLPSQGSLIGAFDEIESSAHTLTIQPGDLIAVFSDGAHELFHADASMLNFEEFIEILRSSDDPPQKGFVERVFHKLQAFHGKSTFEDDYSMLGIRFN